LAIPPKVLAAAVQTIDPPGFSPYEIATSIIMVKAAAMGRVLTTTHFLPKVCSHKLQSFSATDISILVKTGRLILNYS
jgi:hypothetical protein